LKINKADLVDLHMHSNFSDGILSPAALAETSAKAGLIAFSLTDHDTLDGLKEALAATKRLTIEFVPGIEMSCLLGDREVHILGYYPQQSDQLLEVLKRMQDERRRRIEKVITALRNLGFKLDLDDLKDEAKDAAPGRLHLARLLLKRKYVHTVDEAFKLYLGKGKPAYVSRKLLTAAEVLQLLKDCGAITVLAHPGREGKGDVDSLLTIGLDGVEVFHPDHSPSLVKYYKGIAEKYNLLITGGSDFHGDFRSHILYSTKHAIDLSYLEKLKAKKCPLFSRGL
jgi:3',5'-nucleoside bisphosphate phosphatase